MTLPDFRWPIRSADVWGLSDKAERDREDIAADLDYQDNVLEQYLSDLQVLIGQGGGGSWTLVAKSANESVTSSTTLQNDDHMFFTAASGVIYAVRVVLRATGDPSGDIKVAFGEDGFLRGGFTTASLDTSGAASIIASHPSDQSALARGITADETPLVFEGFHTGAGGTFRVLWAQNSSNIVATSVRAGSYLEYNAVA